MKDDIKRREFITTQTKKLGIDITFIDAVDGIRLKMADNPCGLKIGEFGCALSHYCTLASIDLLPDEEFLILEDDAIFCEDFLNKFEKFYDNLPSDWEMAYLGWLQWAKVVDVININEYVGKMKSLELTHPFKFMLSNHAYMIKKPTAKILKEALYPLNMALDVAFMRKILPHIKYYISTSFLVSQASFEYGHGRNTKFSGWESKTWIERNPEIDSTEITTGYGFFQLESFGKTHWKWTGNEFKFYITDGIANIEVDFISPIANVLTLETDISKKEYNIVSGENTIRFEPHGLYPIIGRLKNVYIPAKNEDKSNDIRELGIRILRMRTESNGSLKTFEMNTIQCYLPEIVLEKEVNKIKNIGVLFLPRSGSHWIAYHLNNFKNIYSLDGEMFNSDTCFIDKELYEKLKPYYSIPKNFCFESLNILAAELLKDRTRFLTIVKTFLPQDKMFAFKLGYPHVNIDDKVYRTLDYVVISYRRNVLEQWISYKNAEITNKWCCSTESDKYPVSKIQWNSEEFLKFREEIYNKTKIYKRITKNVPHVFMAYEEWNVENITVAEQNTILYNKLKEIHIDCGDIIDDTFKNKFIKQLTYKTYEECFTNYDDFVNFANKELFMLEIADIR